MDLGSLSRVARAREVKRKLPSPAELAFPAQRPLVLSTSKRDVACLPRQAGKTTAAVLRAFRVAQDPRSRLVTYVTKTRKNGKRLFWRPLLEVAEKLGYDVVGCANQSELTFKVQHADGSYCLIEILGAHDEEQIELLLGTQYDLAIIDEAAYIRPLLLEQLLRRVLLPGLRARQGSLLLIGTPGPVKFGPFYDAWSNAEWTKFRFTAWDNPYTPPGSIEQEIAELGLKPTDAIYFTEYLGEWYDGPDSRRVWDYDPGRNSPDCDLPTDAASAPGWKFSWGVDLASAIDNDALVVWGWRPDDGERRLYEVDSWEGPGSQTVDELEAVLKRKKEQWRPSCAVGDSAAMGRKVLNTLAPRLGIAWQEKPSDVEATVRLMNSDLRAGRLRVRRSGALAQDMQMEVWDVNERTGKRTIGGPEHSDLTSSARYGYMAAYAFRAKAAPVVPEDPDMRRELEIRAYLAQQEAQKRQSRWRRAG